MSNTETITKLAKNQRKCIRCGHVWFIRRANSPIICPRCKTSSWNEKEIPKKFVLSCESCGAKHDSRSCPAVCLNETDKNGNKMYVSICHTCSCVL